MPDAGYGCPDVLLLLKCICAGICKKCHGLSSNTVKNHNTNFLGCTDRWRKENVLPPPLVGENKHETGEGHVFIDKPE